MKKIVALLPVLLLLVFGIIIVMFDVSNSLSSKFGQFSVMAMSNETSPSLILAVNEENEEKGSQSNHRENRYLRCFYSETTTKNQYDDKYTTTISNMNGDNIKISNVLLDAPGYYHGYWKERENITEEDVVSSGMEYYMKGADFPCYDQYFKDKNRMNLFGKIFGPGNRYRWEVVDDEELPVEFNFNQEENNVISPQLLGQKSFLKKSTKKSTNKFSDEKNICTPRNDYNRNNFCQVIHKNKIKKMMIVGDSINLQLTVSLLGLLKASIDEPQKYFVPKVEFYDKWEPIRIHLCDDNNSPSQELDDENDNDSKNKKEDKNVSKNKINKNKINDYEDEKDDLEHGFELIYVRNDILYPNHVRLNDSKQSVDNKEGHFGWFPGANGPFTSILEKEDIDLLLINSGAHFHHFSQYKKSIDHFMNYMIEAIKKKKFQGQLIWRNTPVGHPHCETRERPTYYNVQNISNELQKSFLERPYNQFSYEKFNEYNLYTIRRFQQLFNENNITNYFDTNSFNKKRRKSQFDVLYADRILYNRPDFHRAISAYPKNKDPRQLDCLHYCLPGPIDQISVALYNLLESKLD